MKILLSLGVVLGCLIGVVGCGGSGGGNKTESRVSSAGASLVSSAVASSLEASSAVQSSAGNTDDIKKGYFRDAPVKELSYVSCNAEKTECLQGKTDANGEYLYKSGFNVVFNIENLIVMETTAKELITPYDESLTEQQSVGLARFLMSLDEDGNLNNGIAISEEVKNLAKNTKVGTYIDWYSDDQLNKISSDLNVNLPSPEEAIVHLGASKFLRYSSEQNVEVINWFLNKKNLSSSVNGNTFNRSPSARLEYAIFTQIGTALLVNTDLVDSVAKAEKIDKVAGLAIDWAKTLTNIAVLNLDALGKSDAVIEKIYVAADTGKFVTEIIQNGVKTVHVIDGKDTGMEDQISSAMKMVFIGVKGDIVDFHKESFANFIAESEESKVLGELLGVALGEIEKSLATKSIKDIIDRRGALIDTAAVGAKAAVKFVLTGLVSTANTQAQEYQFAYDYLNAYYSSGGDPDFMLSYFKMPLDLDKAANNHVDSDVVEIILGTPSYTKRLRAKKIVQRYQNMINSSYKQFVYSIGGIPLDNLFISLKYDSNNSFICVGESVTAEATFFDGEKNGSVLTPFSIDWIVDDGVSAIILANKINLSFDKAGLYFLTLRAKKWAGGVSQLAESIDFSIIDCKEGNDANETVDLLIAENNVSADPNLSPIARVNAVANTAGEILLSATDSYDPDGAIVRYVWMEGNTIVGRGKELTLRGRSEGNYTFTLKVTDNRGAVQRETTSVTLVLPKPLLSIPKSLSFDSVPIGQSKTLPLTIRNSGNAELTGISLSLNSAEFQIGSMPSRLAAGTEAIVQVTFTPEAEVPSSAAITIKSNELADASVSLTGNGIANKLLVRVIPSATRLRVNDELKLRIEITDGNPAYKVNINWGDGRHGTYDSSQSEIFASHTYTSEATNTLKITVTDLANKVSNYTAEITVSNVAVTKTAWIVDARHIGTNEYASNIPVTVSPAEVDGNTLQTFTTNWKPKAGSDNNYFVKYRLPVPSGIIKLTNNVRMTVIMSAANVASYDRELAFVTDKGELVASWIAEVEPPIPGYIRVKDFNANDVKFESGLLNDDPLLKPIQSYAIEWRATEKEFSAQRYANSVYSPLEKLGYVAQTSLNELNITFKGNGKIYLVKIEYDKNGNGQYDDGYIVANTANQNIDWSIYGGADNGSVIEPEMIAIPGTTYSMSKYETTFAQYDAYVEETGVEKPSDEGWGRGNRPVIYVSLNDAVAYAEWLSQKTGKNYRLPTEDEWEFSARAGTTTDYSWGDHIGTNNANCSGCGSQWDGVSTAPVGSFKPNAFGLFDMHSNVSEWTSSCWALDQCDARVLSGGSWDHPPLVLRWWTRTSAWSSYRYNAGGFRLVKELLAQVSSSSSYSSQSSESSANQSLSSGNSSSLMGSSSSVSSELQSSSSSTSSSNSQSSQPLSNVISGAWVASGSCHWANPLCDSWLVFLDESNYFSIQTSQPDNGCTVGVEKGTYMRNAVTGVFQVSPQFDGNNHCGVSDAGAGATLVLSGNQLSYKEVANSAPIGFVKAASGSTHLGTWIISENNHTEVLALADTTFMRAIYKNGMEDVELGYYNYNQITGEFQITNFTKDKNTANSGFTGLSNIKVVVNNNQLTITSDPNPDNPSVFSRLQ